MDIKIYESKYTSIIDKLNLDDLQKELLKGDWLFYINHLENLTKKHYFRYRFYTSISIIGGISIPAISAFPIPETLNKMIVSIIGVITAVCIGLNQSYKFNDKWKHYRREIEMARIEGERFVALAGDAYIGKTHEQAIPIFIDRLSILKQEEIKDYFDTLNNALLKNAEK